MRLQAGSLISQQASGKGTIAFCYAGTYRFPPGEKCGFLGVYELESHSHRAVRICRGEANPQGLWLVQSNLDSNKTTVIFLALWVSVFPTLLCAPANPPAHSRSSSIYPSQALGRALEPAKSPAQSCTVILSSAGALC